MTEPLPPPLVDPPQRPGSPAQRPGIPDKTAPSDKPLRSAHAQRSQQQPKRKAWVYMVGYLTSAIVGIGGGLIGLHYINKDRDMYRDLSSIPISSTSSLGGSDLADIRNTSVVIEDIWHVKTNGESIYAVKDSDKRIAVMVSRSSVAVGTPCKAKRLGNIFVTNEKPVRYVPEEQLRGKPVPPNLKCVQFLLHVPQETIDQISRQAAEPSAQVVIAQAEKAKAEAQVRAKQAELEKAKIDADRSRRVADERRRAEEEQREREELKQFEAAEQAALLKAIKDEEVRVASISKAIIDDLSGRATMLEQAVLKDGQPLTAHNVPREFAQAKDPIFDDIDEIRIFWEAHPEAEAAAKTAVGYTRYVSACTAFVDLYQESQRKFDKWSTYVDQLKGAEDRIGALRERREMNDRIAKGREATRQDVQTRTRRTKEISLGLSGPQRRYNSRTKKWETWDPGSKSWRVRD